MNASTSQVRGTERWTLLLEPLGVLMFRDHRPFDAGQHVLARSQYPMPSVFRGAIRTALFHTAGADFRRAKFGLDDQLHAILGSSEEAEAFELSGPLLAVLDASGEPAPLFPWPADLFMPKNTPHQMLLRPHERSGPHASTSLRLGPPTAEHARSLECLDVALPWLDQSVGKPASGTRWLTSAGAELYVKAERQKLELKAGSHWIDQGHLMDFEERVGIARATRDTDRLVAAESMLYILQTWRLAEGVRFAVEVDLGALEGAALDQAKELLHQIDGTLLRLGGRSQHARIKLVEHSLVPDFMLREPSEGQPHKLWVWTPALFDPAALAASNQRLRGALAERVRVGGYDMATGRPRPLLSGLAKGAVLWFDAPNLDALRNHQERYACENRHPSPRGYGHGVWIPTVNTSTSES